MYDLSDMYGSPHGAAKPEILLWQVSYEKPSPPQMRLA